MQKNKYFTLTTAQQRTILEQAAIKKYHSTYSSVRILGKLEKGL